MKRQDEGLAFMLRYENVALYEDGAVRILDRRVYPAETRFVTCGTHLEVAKAIKDMVTQSAGPYTAAPMGVALAAFECRGMKKEEQLEYLRKAADTIAHARPTTAKRMETVCGQALRAAEKALEEGRDASLAVRDRVIEMNDERYARIGRIAEHLVSRFPDGGAVMTHCFAETIIGMMLKECRERGKTVRLFCPETRPFFQGARLTATCARDMGFDVTVITDNMAAFVMKKEKIDVFTTAADAICVDGHVVNKVGTLQNAISAEYFGIPYYVTGAPDPGHPTVDTVTIEMRDPEESLYAMGVRTAPQGVRGYYPAFDITPPELIAGVVTDLGIYPPFELGRYFDDAGGGRDRVVV